MAVLSYVAEDFKKKTGDGMPQIYFQLSHLHESFSKSGVVSSGSTAGDYFELNVHDEMMKMNGIDCGSYKEIYGKTMQRTVKGLVNDVLNFLSHVADNDENVGMKCVDEAVDVMRRATWRLSTLVW
jgi:hypothetical protein